MITRRVVLWCLGLAILAVVGWSAAAWIERLQMSADSADTLVNREAERVQKVMSKAVAGARGLTPNEQTQQGWERIAEDFEQAGLVPEETASVTSAMKDQLRINPMAPEAFFVPRYVRRGWVRGEETWLFAFGWGMRDIDGGRSEGAGHFLVMAIHAEPPHKVLAARQCK